MLVTNFLSQIPTFDLVSKSVTREPLDSWKINNTDLSCQTDEEIFAAFTKGDISALGTIYDRYGLLVYRLIHRMLDNIQEAEDLTQEIFLNLQVKPKFNSQRGSFYTYLMMVTRSRAIDRLRSKRSQGRFWQDIGKLKDSVEEQKSHTPMEVISFKERSAKVQNALNHLSRPQRQILKLYYFEGLSQSEIAKRLNIPLGTVKSHSRRGLLQLKKNLHHSHLI